MKIDWSLQARIDLGEIVSHIAQDSPRAAYRIHDEIVTRIESLSDHPAMGRRGRVRGTRELVITSTSYLAIYGVGERSVFVLRVLHGAQRWP